jgi:hypothetical protein
MIDMLIAIAHWCASCAPAGTGVPTTLGAFSGAAGAAGGMSGMSGLAGGDGDGGTGTEGNSSSDAPYSSPGSASSSSSSSSSSSGSGPGGPPAGAPGPTLQQILQSDGIEPDPYGQAIVGLVAGGFSALGQGVSYGVAAGGTEAVVTVAGESAMVVSEETDPVGAANAVGSFFASPFTTVYTSDQFPSDAGPDATVPDAGQGNTTAPYCPPPPPPYDPGPPPPTPPEQTGLLDPVIDGAKVVGSFFASPFTPVHSADEFPSDAGPDATLPSTGHGDNPDGGAPPTDPPHP